MLLGLLVLLGRFPVLGVELVLGLLGEVVAGLLGAALLVGLLGALLPPLLL